MKQYSPTNTSRHSEREAVRCASVPGMCIVVMVVVVISVVVVSSSKGSRDIGFLAPGWPAVEEELKEVVRNPGDMGVAVDSVCLNSGTACVGLVVVPARRWSR